MMSTPRTSTLVAAPSMTASFFRRHVWDKAEGTRVVLMGTTDRYERNIFTSRLVVSIFNSCWLGDKLRRKVGDPKVFSPGRSNSVKGGETVEPPWKQC